MPTFGFNKLVRDNFPEIYESLGQKILTRSLTPTEYRAALRNKIIEEANELPVDKNVDPSIMVDEIADLEQILDDLKRECGVSSEAVAQRRAEKFAQKGGFATGLFVVSITLKEGDDWINYYRAEPKKYPEEGYHMKSFLSISRGEYKHTKTGKTYQVLGVAFQTETEELLVVYKPLYDSDYELFARPYDMFNEEVTINGKVMPRFVKIDE